MPLVLVLFRSKSRLRVRQLPRRRQRPQGDRHAQRAPTAEQNHQGITGVLGRDSNVCTGYGEAL